MKQLQAACISLLPLVNGFQFLNQTGGSFPAQMYAQSTFAYSFVDSLVSIDYYGPSSTVGACNIMGYWHTGNNNAFGRSIPSQQKSLDTVACTDKCSIELCGYIPAQNGSIILDGHLYNGLPVRADSGVRIPLTDIGASDNLKPADYYNFPDLQVFPAIAGAVVPIYNIPDFDSMNITSPLILSRSTLVNIFLGNITVSLCTSYQPTFDNKLACEEPLISFAPLLTTCTMSSFSTNTAFLCSIGMTGGLAPTMH